MEQLDYFFTIVIGPGLIIFLFVSKINYRFFKNKSLHSTDHFKNRVCPYCNNEVRKKERFCKTCDQQIVALSKQELYCTNCGKIEDIKYYLTYGEFWVTFALWGLLGIFPRIIYLFSYYDKKICYKCNSFR